MRLVQLRGPDAYTSGLAQQLFLSLRSQGVCMAFLVMFPVLVKKFGVLI